MANRFAVATGNWSATATWDGGTLPTSADDVYANGFTVTINQSATVLSVRTTSAAGIAAGGGFSVSATGYTLTLTGTGVVAGTTPCITSTVGAGGTFTVSAGTANIQGGSAGNASGINHTGAGTLNVTGRPVGGSASSAAGVTCTTGTLILVGDSTAGSISNAYGVLYSGALTNSTITGNVTGGTAGEGLRNSSMGTITVTGNATGGSGGSAHGIANVSTGTVNLIGNATGGTASSIYGVSNGSTGVFNITGSAFASAAAVGATNGSSGVLRVVNAVGNGFGLGSVGIAIAAAVDSATNNSLTYVQQLTFGSLGATPTRGPIILTDLTTNSVQFYREGGGTKTLVDPNATAGVLPAVGDVRSGTVYAAGNRTGTCAVPAAGSVALGVPVDNTTGTAVLTAANVQTALTSQGLTTTRAGYLDNLDATVSSRLAPSGTLARVTLVDTATTLTNAPTVPTAAQIASQVRVELTPELARMSNASTTQEVGNIVEGLSG